VKSLPKKLPKGAIQRPTQRHPQSWKIRMETVHWIWNCGRCGLLKDFDVVIQELLFVKVIITSKPSPWSAFEWRIWRWINTT
jgi:hypothetical protein